MKAPLASSPGNNTRMPPNQFARPAPLTPKPCPWIRDTIVTGATSGAVVTAAPWLGVDDYTPVGVVAGIAATALVGVRGARRKLRDRDVDRTIEQLCAVMGQPPNRAVLTASRWTLGGWPGRPGRLKVRYQSAGMELDPEFLVRVTEIVAGQVWGDYKLVQHDRRRCILRFAPAAITAAEEAEAEAIARAKRKVLTMLGPTGKITRTELDDTGELAALEATHDIGEKLVPSGYRARIEKTVSAVLPGRWRAKWDLERDWVRFEVRPAFASTVWMPVPGEEIDDPYEDCEIPFGIDEDGNVLTWKPWQDPHMMLVGATGTGKTVTAHNVMLGCALRKWMVWIVDGKGTEFLGYRTWPNVQVVASTIEHQIAVIHRAWEEMERRYEAIFSGRADESDFTPMLLVLDEFADFRANLAIWYQLNKVKGDPTQPRTMQEVASLARKGRTARVHMLFGTQRPDADFFQGRLTGDMRDNFRMRISMGRLSPQGAQMMWESPSVGTTIPRGCRGRATTINDDNVAVEIQTYRTLDPRRAREGQEGYELIAQLRPAEVTHERLVILDPMRDPQIAEAIETEDPKNPISRFTLYSDAAWGWAADHPSVDPALIQGSDGATADPLPTLLGLSEFLAPRARRETPASGESDAATPPGSHPSSSGEARPATGKRNVGSLLAAAAGSPRPSLSVVPPLPDLADDVDEDEDDWEGYQERIDTVDPMDLHVGDLVLVDEDRGEWGVVDSEPGPDEFDDDGDQVSVTYRAAGDVDGVLSIPSGGEISVRRPLEFELV